MKSMFGKNLIIIFILLLSTKLPAKYLEYNVDLGIEKFYGYTQYQIGGKFTDPDGNIYQAHFPISELEFPLDVIMLSTSLDLKLEGKYKFNLGFKTNLAKNAGTMVDLDWGAYYLDGFPWADPYSLDVKSESDAKLRAYIVKGDFQYLFWTDRDYKVFGGIGYTFQSFYYEVFDMVQWSPSYYDQYSAYLPYDIHQSTAPGKNLSYLVNYHIINFILFSEYKFNPDLEFTGAIALSPLVFARDIDDHILRSKRNEGSSRGTAASLDLGAKYSIKKRVFIKAGFYLAYIYTMGTQYQYFYKNTLEANAGPVGTIENTLESLQMSFDFRCGIAF